MFRHNLYQFGPKKAPSLIKTLVILTISISLLCSIFAKTIPFIPFLFTLSYAGIKKLFLWQILTQLFCQNSFVFNAGFAIHLFFNSYIIWTIGSALLERKSSKSLFYLILSTGIFSSITALITMNIFNLSTIFTGNTLLLYILLIAWMILNPHARLLLFFAIPFKACNLITALLGFNLVLFLSNGQFIYFFTYLLTSIFTYLYIIFFWNEKSPFMFLNNFENSLHNLRHKFSRIISRKPTSYYQNAKIYDFKSQKPTNQDELFINAMLEKISKNGIKSLSLFERIKLKRLSKKTKKPI
ncbi:MAG TPA: rhomboid family intramembrane serine protease [Chlamydiales bacterium]|nr:rhomboid family intramembrane serine protease [Chlamydiales bacterium]